MALSDRLQSQFFKQLGTMGAGGPIPGQGGADLGQAGAYWRTILGGNRQAAQAAVAPAANAARDQADAAKRQQAQVGTARTGGTAAANQQTEDEIRKQIDTLIGNMQGQAAQQLKGISDSELNTMMNSLGIGTSAVQSDINSRRAASAQMWSALIGGAADVATGGIAAIGAKGLGGGGDTPTGAGPGISYSPSIDYSTPVPWTPPTFGFPSYQGGPYA